MFTFSVPLIIMLSFMFTRMNHPLSSGLILLIQTILISVSSGLFSSTYWFSYILFLIFLGGMLVLFIYVTSLASNEPFKIKSEFLLMIFLVFLASGTLMLFDPIYLANKFSVPVSSSSSVVSPEASMAALTVSLIYNKPSAFLTFFIISYLLLALFVIVKIMGSSSAPLRLET